MSPPAPSAPAPVATTRPGYLPGLDGLRAISVFAVVAYHLGEIRGGFLGVDVFFVISGFLITRLLLDERERSGAIALGAFWLRRFKRLLPALLVLVAAVALGSRLWLPAWRLGAIRFDALAALFYVANWRFILSGQSYFASGVAPSPLRHTWSLAIEEQYYVLWPLVVVGAARVARVRARQVVAWVAGVGALASAAWMAVAASAGLDLSRIYYGTDTRAFALFAGAWLATWWDPAAKRGTRAERRTRGRRWAVAGLVAAVPMVALFGLASTKEVAFYQGGFQAMAVISLLVVAGVATGASPLAGLCANRVLVWLGRRSYGIYLWSWPTQVFAQEHFHLDGLVLDAVVVAVAVSLAAVSFWLVEEPIRTGTRPAGLSAQGAARGGDSGAAVRCVCRGSRPGGRRGGGHLGGSAGTAGLHDGDRQGGVGQRHRADDGGAEGGAREAHHHAGSRCRAATGTVPEERAAAGGPCGFVGPHRRQGRFLQGAGRRGFGGLVARLPAER